MLNLKPGDRVTWYDSIGPCAIGMVATVTKYHFTVDGRTNKYRLRNGKSLEADAWSQSGWREHEDGDGEFIRRRILLNEDQSHKAPVHELRGQAEEGAGMMAAKDEAKWLQRAPPKLHRELKALAETTGVSLNSLVIMILKYEVDRRTTCEKCGGQL